MQRSEPIITKLTAMLTLHTKCLSFNVLILQRVLRFLPAHIKLQNAFITQQDCLKYLQNDGTDKLVLLDVPYIGLEHTCAVAGYKYQSFHKKVTDSLQNTEYPFLYYCRSTPPKSDSIYNSNCVNGLSSIFAASCIAGKECEVIMSNTNFYKLLYKHLEDFNKKSL